MHKSKSSGKKVHSAGVPVHFVQRKAVLRPPLSHVLGFREEDLTANANGRLGVRQQTRLLRQERTLKSSIGASGLLVGVLVVMFAVWFIVAPTKMRVGLTVASPIAVLIGVFFVIHSIWKWWNFRASLSRDVESIEGTVLLEIKTLERRHGSSTTYHISVGDTEFTVDGSVYLAFKDEAPYRIYYLPGSMTIVSVERLRGK